MLIRKSILNYTKYILAFSYFFMWKSELRDIIYSSSEFEKKFN